MTATDELRRLLDERGVEYRVSATGYSIDIGPNMTAYANRTDTTLDVSLRGFTPEQAIEATLGRGTCHSDNNPPLLYDDPFRVFRCSECHYKVDLRHNPKPNYCPNCGRKVVDA